MKAKKLTATFLMLFMVTGLLFTTNEMSDAASRPDTVPCITAKLSGSKKLKITWSKGTGASKYYVYQKKGGGGFKKVKVTSGRSYTTKTLKKNVKYKYKVRSWNSGGYGNYSPTVSGYAKYSTNGSSKNFRKAKKAVSHTWQTKTYSKKLSTLAELSAFKKTHNVTKVDVQKSGSNNFGYLYVYVENGNIYTSFDEPLGVWYSPVYRYYKYCMGCGKRFYFNENNQWTNECEYQWMNHPCGYGWGEGEEFQGKTMKHSNMNKITVYYKGSTACKGCGKIK